MHKLVLEIDLTDALSVGEMAPGFPGLNTHQWSEEQTKYILGFVLRKIGENLAEDTNQPCIDYANYDEFDAPEGMFKSSSYDESVVEGSDEDNLMCAQESMLSVAIAISDKMLEMSKGYGVQPLTKEQIKANMTQRGYNIDVYYWRGECHFCKQPITETEPAAEDDEYSHKTCKESWKQQYEAMATPQA